MIKEADVKKDMIINRIALDVKGNKKYVAKAIDLLDEGNTVPFIARYRKEWTGGMTDENLRLVADKLTLYRNMEKRREDVLRLLAEQGVLSEELESQVLAAKSVTEMEDLYRPYRPKKRTRATMAREKGLEPLAEFILAGQGDPREESLKYLQEEVATPEEALAGALDIVAETISDEPRVRQLLRALIFNEGVIRSQNLKEEGSSYEMYYDFSQSLKKLQPHRVLALNRGEREDVLQVKIDSPQDKILSLLEKKYVKEGFDIECRDHLKEAILDSWKRLLSPSLEREVRSTLTEQAEEQALKIFRENLKGLLLTSPVPGKRVLGLDPGYRTGCKLACIDETGKLLETAVIFPTPPRNEKEKSSQVVKSLIQKHTLNAVVIGNGTGGRESEEFIADVISHGEKTVEYAVVNEAGASVYSASKLGQKEFPHLDVAERSAISIARRVQDPLAELVKIDPRSIGVGQYQHDVNQKRLKEELGGVVEDCVNRVGVDLNTASAALLERVAGINKTVATSIVAYREEQGAFTGRSQLSKVPKLGPATFKQCAGFLRLPQGENYFDRSAVHPESYAIAEKLMDVMGITPAQLGSGEAIPSINIQEVASELGTGEPTLRDIIDEFKKPGRDPREGLSKPVFKKGVIQMEDLREGMELMGEVRNVVDFGAFVDIGVHQDGLVHISQLSDTYVRHPLEVVKVGDVVETRVLAIDLDRKRISLTMKKA